MKKYRIIGLAVLFGGAIALAALYIGGSNLSVLDPKGEIAAKERDLIWVSTLLMLVVVLPVFALTFFIAWKYRASNPKARYQPGLDGDRRLELLWWAIPSMIILVLTVITWRSTHQLDPSVPLNSTKPPLTVQVVALQWKWLFIYPEHSVASINQLNIPVDRPVSFIITADAPMNSLWIPQLGGQIYAMAGMSTRLHLQAAEPGSYRGSSANISGRGFADMDFWTIATDEGSFQKWLEAGREAKTALNYDQYQKLAKPSSHEPARQYRLADRTLYDKVLAKYRAPDDTGGGHGY